MMNPTNNVAELIGLIIQKLVIDTSSAVMCTDSRYTIGVSSEDIEKIVVKAERGYLKNAKSVPTNSSQGRGACTLQRA